jgi:hypothetical protein
MIDRAAALAGTLIASATVVGPAQVARVRRIAAHRGVDVDHRRARHP